MLVTDITTTQGSAPAPANTVVIGDIGSLAPGATVTITITGILQGSGDMFNQATVNGNETGVVDSDGNGDSGDGNQPTQFPVAPTGLSGQPLLSLSKTAATPGDVNGDGVVNPGEIVRFTIVVLNQGNAAASGVLISDDLAGVNGSLVSGSVQTSRGSVLGEDPITVAIATLLPGESATLSFDLVAGSTGQLTNRSTVGDEQGNTAEDDATVDIAAPNVFDPPSGRKVVSDAGLPELEWRMVWLNSGNAVALNVLITDPIPENSVYIAGSVLCEARGASTVVRCEFDSAANRIVYEGNIAADEGAGGEDDALNEVVIVYRTAVIDITRPVANQATANWDADGDGFIGDDSDDGQIPVVTDDPFTPADDDPTVWQLIPMIPTLSVWMMLLLSLLLVGLGYRRLGHGAWLLT
jgi:uncharacterized repeat protein (TIGR01451 family)